MAKTRKNTKRKDENIKINEQIIKASKQYLKPEEEIHSGKEFEYRMPFELYNSLVYECIKNKLGDTHKYLCDYVNEQNGLFGVCVRVTPF